MSEFRSKKNKNHQNFTANPLSSFSNSWIDCKCLKREKICCRYLRRNTQNLRAVLFCKSCLSLGTEIDQTIDRSWTQFTTEAHGHIKEKKNFPFELSHKLLPQAAIHNVPPAPNSSEIVHIQVSYQHSIKCKFSQLSVRKLVVTFLHP